MKTPESWLRQINKLREKHTALVALSKWTQAQTVREKIILAWRGYWLALSETKPQ